MKSIFKFLCFILIILCPLNGSAFSEEKIKIGLIVPLSGEYSSIGQSIINSVRLAVNKIDDNKIEIYPRDTKADPNVTLKVSMTLVFTFGINAIILMILNLICLLYQVDLHLEIDIMRMLLTTIL